MNTLKINYQLWLFILFLVRNYISSANNTKKIMKTDLFKVDDRRKKNAIKKSLKILKTKSPDSFNIASKAIYIYSERLTIIKKFKTPLLQRGY